MKFTRYVKPDDVEALQYEGVSRDLRVYMTRELDRRVGGGVDSQTEVARQNVLVNKSRSIAGLPLYVLEGDLDGLYQIAEQAWHSGEFQLSFLRLTTVQLAEYLGDLIEDDWFTIDEVNTWLDQDGASFYFRHSNGLQAVVLPLTELEERQEPVGHPNLRLLLARMESALASSDYPAVLHASASVFETMAKDIVGIPTVQNQTLKAFFDRYRKDSSLPGPVLDYIVDIYDSRSTVPLAGHGSLQQPQIGREEAVTLCEMTKAFVRIEYSLHQLPTQKP